MLLVITIIIRFNIEKTQVKLIFIIIIIIIFIVIIVIIRFISFFCFYPYPLYWIGFQVMLTVQHSNHIILFIFCQLLIVFLYIVNILTEKKQMLKCQRLYNFESATSNSRRFFDVDITMLYQRYVSLPENVKRGLFIVEFMSTENKQFVSNN